MAYRKDPTHGNVKMTVAQIKEVRRQYLSMKETGARPATFFRMKATEFGVTPDTIYKWATCDCFDWADKFD